MDDKAPPAGENCEIFIGKLPRDVAEDEIYPLFSAIGQIYEMRLMMDFSGSNRGYAFVMYTNAEDAAKACKALDDYQIRPGRKIGVCESINNSRLKIGNLPSDCDISEFSKVRAITLFEIFPAIHIITQQIAHFTTNLYFRCLND